MLSTRFFCIAACVASLFLTSLVPAQEVAKDEAAKQDAAKQEAAKDEATDGPLAGHSMHGEAFNEGPRQAAYLMDGMGSTVFASSAKQEETQKFINQGVAQLHGFWYFEAERSFRQAAKLEPELAIAYWGLAMANANNTKRALEFIKEAEERLKNATEREKSYVRSLAKYLKEGEAIKSDDKLSDDDKKKRQRAREENYIKDLERIVDDSPEDVDAMAFVALQLWMGSRNNLPLASHYAVDGLLDRVFAARPDHPAHHYRIHLWDGRKPANALASAAACGPSLPGIAHMWHMPGHIYSKLHRYHDAAWQQEASARVDHAQMIRDRLMPDQIHNFAHNNEWLIRNLLYLGEAREAIAQAENLVSLPRHPKYNSLEKGGSYRFGRERLIDTYTQFELWDELIAAAQSPTLIESDDFRDSTRRSAWLIVAHQLTGQAKRAGEMLKTMRLQRNSLQRELIQRGVDSSETSGSETNDEAQEEAQDEAQDEAVKTDEAETKQPFDAKKHKEKVTQLGEAITLGAAAGAVRKKDAKLLKKLLERTGRIDGTLKALWLAECGETKDALQSIRKVAKEAPGQVRPQAALVYLLWKEKDEKGLKREFTKLQSMAATADLETPLMKRLAPVAKELGAAEDWREKPESKTDLGERPELDSLGPQHWSPYPMPTWSVVDAEGEAFDSTMLDGKPTVVVFYLGFGCLHCVEQLNAMVPKLDAFRLQGINVIALSTETVDELAEGLKNFGRPMPIPLYSDASRKVFGEFRCLDDFEETPLHGTFLIDSRGHVRWQDIGFEPFMEIDFLLEEADRLLALP